MGRTNFKYGLKGHYIKDVNETVNAVDSLNDSIFHVTQSTLGIEVSFFADEKRLGLPLAYISRNEIGPYIIPANPQEFSELHDKMIEILKNEKLILDCAQDPAD